MKISPYESTRHYEPLKALWCHVIIQACEDILIGIEARKRERENNKYYSHSQIIYAYRGALSYIFDDENYLSLCRWLRIDAFSIRRRIAKMILSAGLKDDLTDLFHMEHQALENENISYRH